MTTSFSAGPQALGYLYQARYSLYTILCNEEFELSVESLDDIAFEADGNPRELLQLKHQTNRAASLTDSSPDLWKTLRVWSELVQSGGITGNVLNLWNRKIMDKNVGVRLAQWY
jgi:hypothetical protein